MTKKDKINLVKGFLVRASDLVGEDGDPDQLGFWEGETMESAFENIIKESHAYECEKCEKTTIDYDEILQCCNEYVVSLNGTGKTKKG